MSDMACMTPPAGRGAHVDSLSDRELFELMKELAAATGDPASAGRATEVVEAGLARWGDDLARACLRGGAQRGNGADYFLPACHGYVMAADTLLHVAAAAHATAACERLLVAGAEVGARNRRKATPLHSVCAGSPETLLHDEVEQVATARLLLAAGADLDACAAGGVTPLHRAVRNRCTALVALLLEAGADRDLRTSRGSTALRLAGVDSGRPGVGSELARAAQLQIIELLSPLR